MANKRLNEQTKKQRNKLFKWQSLREFDTIILYKISNKFQKIETKHNEKYMFLSAINYWAPWDGMNAGGGQEYIVFIL